MLDVGLVSDGEGEVEEEKEETYGGCDGVYS